MEPLDEKEKDLLDRVLQSPVPLGEIEQVLGNPWRSDAFLRRVVRMRYPIFCLNEVVGRLETFDLDEVAYWVYAGAVDFVWENSGMAVTEIGIGGYVFDVFGVKYYPVAQRSVRVFEVKVTRTDFRSDRKWPKYLPYCDYFYFACPPGLIKKEEVPAGVGLLYCYRSFEGWGFLGGFAPFVVARGARRHERTAIAFDVAALKILRKVKFLMQPTDVVKEMRRRRRSE